MTIVAPQSRPEGPLEAAPGAASEAAPGAEPTLLLEAPLPAVAVVVPQGPLWPRVVSGALLSLAVLALGFAGYLTLASRVQFDRTQTTLYATLRDELKRSVAPIAGPIPDGAPLALLEIPALGSRLVVVEGATAPDLTRGVGHRSDTVLPGQAGLSIVLGRRSTFGGPFSRLDKLRAGDTLDVTTGQGSFTYIVDTVARSDRPAPALAAAAGRLSLVTGDPVWSADHSLVVSAVLKGTPAAATARPSATEAERPSNGDPAAAFPFALWSVALLLAATGTAYLAGRVSALLLWVGAAPVLLAVVWNVYESLVGLLPNTL